MTDTEYSEIKNAMREYDKKVFEAREELDEVIYRLFMGEENQS